MNLQIIRTVFIKELTDAFRDRRTMFIMIVLPVLIMPAVMIGIPALTIEKQKVMMQQPSEIVVIGYESTMDQAALEEEYERIGEEYDPDINADDALDQVAENLSGNQSIDETIDMVQFRIQANHTSWFHYLLGPQLYRALFFQPIIDRLAMEIQLRENGSAPVNYTDYSKASLESTKDSLESLIDMRIRYSSKSQLDREITRLRDGEIHAIVEIDPNILRKEREREQADLTYHGDVSNTKSRIAVNRIQQVHSYYTQLIQTENLLLEGLEEDDIEFIQVPLRTFYEEESTESDRGGFFLSMILPMILGIYVVSGSMYTTIDITAGEKERHTLEALLVTPPARTNLVLGKFLTILTITILIIVVAMLAMVLSLNLGSRYIDTFENISFELTPQVMAIVVVIFFFLAVMVNALEMAICFLAKSFKEAQNYVTPLTFAVLFPAILLQGIAVEDAPWWLFVLPIINVLALFQEVLLGAMSIDHLMLVIGTSVMYALVSSVIAIKTFEREDILFRS
jgi:sodium transport system permease protein